MENIKRFIGIIFFVMILGLFTVGCSPTIKDFVYIDDILYQHEETIGEKEIYKRGNGGKLTIDYSQVRGKSYKRHSDRVVYVNIEGEKYKVSGDRYKVTVIYPDGKKAFKNYSRSNSNGVSFSSGGGDAYGREPSVDDFRKIVFNTEENDTGSFIGVVFALLFFFGGLLSFMKPDLAWTLSEGWKYKDVEPSDTYIFISKAMGMLFMIGSGLYIVISIVS